MGIFGKIDAKFVKLVTAIDERYKLYEKLLTEGDPDKLKPEVRKSLELLLQELRNIKIRAWSIETGEKTEQLIKDLHEDDIMQKLGGDSDGE